MTTNITEETTREELLEIIEILTKKLELKGNGRKESVLKLLNDGFNSIQSIAEEIGITSKNVSSQLTYLRQDGYKIISYRDGGKSVLEMR